tara:strand:+ start:171 stop:473 length:303 start_codon:yes stop_codon:yes gene_type:complete
MAEWIIFEDSTNDQHAYPVKNINAIFITSSTNITVYARNPVQPTESVSDDTIALTCTADTVYEVLTAILAQINNERNSTLIINVENFVGNITTVAYTAGA